MFLVVITLFLLVCAGFHVYLYRKLARAFRLTPLTGGLLILLFGIMSVAPATSRLLDHIGFPVVSRMINFPVFIWLAWLFWFFMAGLSIDLWNVLCRRTPFSRWLVIPVRQQVQGLFILIALTTGWSLHEAAIPRVVPVVIRSALLSGSQPIRIVQVSDVHLSLMRSAAWNQMICQTIASLKPDILVSTGDLVDTPYENLKDEAALWAAIHPPLGKFAVLGNHEFYLGLTDSLTFHEKAGFRVLRSQSVDIGPLVQLSGVDDPDGKRLGQPCYNLESTLVTPPDEPRFRILLKHRPTVEASTAHRFNLQLSGHTHNGQLFPFKLFVWMNHKYLNGMYAISGDFKLYVSSGTGTWGPPMRLFAPPEITVFTLMP